MAATPPCACAIWRSASIRAAWSPSSITASRYAAACAGCLSCSISQGSYGTLAATARLFLRSARFVVGEIFFGTLDVLLLRPLVSSVQEKNDHTSKPREVHTIARPPIDPKLHNSPAHRLRIAEIAGR